MNVGWPVALLVCCGLALGVSSQASAQPDEKAEAAIREALATWTRDFNARKAAHICDLFAPDLVYDYRGFPERNYDTLCALLHRSLADRSRTFS